MYTEHLKNFSWVRTQVVAPDARMSWFVYVVTLAEGLERDRVMQEMTRRGVPVRGYFSPIHQQPYIRERFGSTDGQFPVTESIAQRTIALPFHNELTPAQIEQVVTTLSETVARL
jgi:perosamine synthetase